MHSWWAYLGFAAWTPTASPPRSSKPCSDVGKVALNDLAKRVIVQRGERKGTCALLGPQYGDAG